MFGTIDGTGYEILDSVFEDYIIVHAKIERLWSGGRWLEGPAYFPGGRYLIWSDIPNNRMMRWDETDGSVSVFRDPSNNSNGHTVDKQGRLISCEHLSRRVVRTEFDGTLKVIADRYRGDRLNSPNDVVVKSDGSVWFTDPSYGIIMDYEGARAESEIGACNVYRWDPESQEIESMATDYVKPNGLAFSPNETELFITDTGGTHEPDGPRHMRRHSISADGKTLGTGEIFATSTAGFFDGFRIDTGNRIWTSAMDGVHCYDSAGTLIGKILIPEIVSNVCFGGLKGNRLFITATTSLYAIYLNVNGSRL
ncbi:SMP-30/gluconolactonase/LRE family protein [Planktomarina sp.]|nr:SMP-30/gluconolactonase/LRE family protein [Planktomarina sp.]